MKLKLKLAFIFSPLLCFFGRHKTHIAYSTKTGAYATVCLICGKTLDGNDIFK